MNRVLCGQRQTVWLVRSIGARLPVHRAMRSATWVSHSRLKDARGAVSTPRRPLAAPARRDAYGNGHVDFPVVPEGLDEPVELIADPLLHVGRLGEDGRACVDAPVQNSTPQLVGAA